MTKCFGTSLFSSVDWDNPITMQVKSSRHRKNILRRDYPNPSVVWYAATYDCVQSLGVITMVTWCRPENRDQMF